MNNTILIVGATGNLGGQITEALLQQKATVKALVRHSTDSQKVNNLLQKGVQVVNVNFDNTNELKEAMLGVDCVVCALAGLGEVIVDLQKVLVNAAVQAKVPRFIPSDFCTDFTNLTPGSNRNLDYRRLFHNYVNQLPIQTTSIFNGAFMELITGPMPLILYSNNKVLCWGKPTVKMDFTHTHNVATYTAFAALDHQAPRYLHVAGERINALEICNLVTRLAQKPFKLLNPGSIFLFNILIKITKFFSPSSKELYPAWQGMQYMRDMMEGKAETIQNDNPRYHISDWISFEKYLIQEKFPSSIT